MEFLITAWPWYVAGPVIGLVMFALLFFGKSFGVSSTLRTMCTIGGAARWSDFFKINWRNEMWNLVFVFGGLLGGVIASQWMMETKEVAISEATVTDLQALGIQYPGSDYVPTEIFSWENIFTVKGFIFMIVGGFLVGFGTRYAGGCTSGHAISGLSNLQLPSLVAVIGFFIGGLISTFLLLPLIMQL